MRLVSYWRTATKRNSVRVLIVHMVFGFIGALWASLPGAFIDRLPVWVILLISGALASLGLLGAYVAQPKLAGVPDDAGK